MANIEIMAESTPGTGGGSAGTAVLERPVDGATQQLEEPISVASPAEVRPQDILSRVPDPSEPVRREEDLDSMVAEFDRLVIGGGGTGGGGNNNDGNNDGTPRGPEPPQPPESPGPPEDEGGEIRENDRDFRFFHTRRVARIDAMKPAERDKHLAEYEQSVALLHQLAAADKFAGEGRAIQHARQIFDQFQEQQIQREIAENGEVSGEKLRSHLIALENYENQLIEINSGINPWHNSKWDSPEAAAHVDGLPKGDDLYALFGGKNAYEAMKLKKEQFELQIKLMQTDIIKTTGAQFLVDRATYQDRISSLVKGLEAKMSREENIYVDELEDQPLPGWIYQVERELYEDEPPMLASEIISLDQVPISFENLQKQIEGHRGLDFQVTILDKDKKEVEVEARDLQEWYFYEARQLGMFDALDETYRTTYENIRKRVLNTNEPVVAATRRGEPAQATSESSLTDDVLKRFSDEQMESDIKLYESNRAWNETRADLMEQIDESGNTVYQDSFYSGREIPPAEAIEVTGKFKGIKGAFVTRSYQQLFDVTSSLLRTRRSMFDLRQRGLSNTELYKLRQKEEGFERRLEEIRTGSLTGERRLAGEFNIVALERAIQRTEEDRGRTRETPYNFYWSTYELKGANREGVEVSVNAAVRDLMENITAYDANEMLGRMKSIVDAVGRMREPANLQESDIAYFQRTITNRVLFGLAPFFGALVQMENYATILARWADQDGYDRLREIPTMLGGYTAKALWLRNSPEYRLRYRLDGFAGHLSDNQLQGGQLTQRFVRSNLEEMLVDDLMEYEIAGNTPTERAANRAKLNSNITQGELDKLFIVRRVEYSKLRNEIERKRQAGESVNPAELARLRELQDPKEVLKETRSNYNAYLEHLNQKREQGISLTLDEVKEMRRIRREYNDARQRYATLRREVKDAVGFAGQVMDTFGESARIGAPNVRTWARKVEVGGEQKEIKELISVEDMTMLLEHVVIQEAKSIGDHIRRTHKIDLDDNGGLIRWRMRYYLAGGDSNKRNANMEVRVKKMDGTIVSMKASEFFKMFKTPDEGAHGHHASSGDSHHHETADPNGVLSRGFEDTGLTASEFTRLLSAFEDIKTNGTRTIFYGKSVEGIYSDLLGYTGLDANGLRSFFTAFRDKDYDQVVNGKSVNEIYQQVLVHPSLGEEGFSRFLEAYQGNRLDVEIGKTVDEVLEEMRDLKPVLNHYLAVDIYGSDILTDPILRDKAARGKQPFIANQINRLKWFGIESVFKNLPEHTPSSKRVALTYATESSRSFHETIKGLVYYLGTRKDLDQVYDENNYVPITENPYHHSAELSVHGIYNDKTEFDASGMSQGFPNLPLGIKRIMYLNNFWMDFDDLKVARGMSNLPWFRIQVNSLSERLGARDINEVIWNMDKEYFDLPDLQMFAETMKDAVEFRKHGETSIDDKGAVVWGFWDKLLSDAENLWSLISDPGDLFTQVEGTHKLHMDQRNKAVELVEGTLKRYIPMITLMEKAVEHDRNAVGSGAGEETFQRNALKFLGWLLSTGAEQRKLQGGRLAHKDAEAMWFYILQKNTYRENLGELPTADMIKWDQKSVWDRVWEKIKPQANPGISMQPPVPLAIAA